MEKWSCMTITFLITGSGQRGTVSSMDVKSTWSNSPGPLQVKGFSGVIGGAASNLLQQPHFLMRFLRSWAIPGHQNHSCMRIRSNVGPVCCLAMATIKSCTPVNLRDNKLENGLFNGSLFGLPVQEAILHNQLFL